MENYQQTKKSELAKQFLKAHRDEHFGRIDHLAAEKLRRGIMDEAKRHSIGPNEILSDITANEAAYERKLESRFKLRYGIYNTSII